VEKGFAGSFAPTGKWSVGGTRATTSTTRLSGERSRRTRKTKAQESGAAAVAGNAGREIPTTSSAGSRFCDCRTGFIAYRLLAMTCTLQNSLSPSSLNSMPIPEFL
jgi:hypothetical protein